MRFFEFAVTLLALFVVANPAFGQTAQSYNDCTALNGASFSALSTSVTTINVTTLSDSDYVAIAIRVAGDSGTANIGIDAGAGVFFKNSYTVVSGVAINDSTSYDPAGDQTSVAFAFDTEFSAGAAIFVEYTITCTPGGGTTTTTTTTTTAVVSAFLGERAHRLLEESPDRPRMVRKRLEALWGNASTETSESGYDIERGLGFWASPAGGRAHVSLRSLVNVSAVDFPTGTEPPVPSPPTAPTNLGCWDLWAEAHYVNFDDAGDRDGDFAVGYLGVDCQIHPAVIAGVLGQFDWMDDEIGNVNSSTNGVGWMAGPYATARLTPNLFLDVRGAWGQSDNDTNVAGVTGSFDTTRWLVSSQLTGNLQFGDVRMSPEISLSYIQEIRDSYVDSSGASVAAQTVSIGRLRFGPEISRRFELQSGIFVEPSIAIRGLWDFDGTDVTIAGIDYAIEGFRGIAEIGLIIQRPDGFNIRVLAKYDGIGLNDYHAYGGQAWINIPLN
jgi:hypothetical protein